MADASGMIIDRWIREKLPFKWSLSPIVTPRVIQPGVEVDILTPDQLRCDEGVHVTSSLALTSPNVALRLRGDLFDTGDKFTIAFILTTGEWLPNELAWCKGPPTIPYYTLVVGMPWVWKDWGAVSLINRDTIPVTLIKYIYMIGKQSGKPSPEEVELKPRGA